MSESTSEDRTLDPTEKRLREAREHGDLAISREANMLASLVGAGFGATVLVPPQAHRLAGKLANFLGSLDSLRIGGSGLTASIISLLTSTLTIIAAVALPASLCVIAAVLLQSGFFIGGKPIKFDPGRLSPGAGFGRLFSRHNLMEFLKSLGKLCLLAGIVWSVLGNHPLGIISVASQDLGALLPQTMARVEQLLRPLLAALLCFAAIDVIFVRRAHMQKLRMSREEVRQEHRESEGDPFIKAKLRRIRMQRARRRMMEKVKTADVIITNPTHYAVALRYERDKNVAPTVVAKGVDFLAARIREEAEKHDVPIMPNPPLARALYLVELDHEIPTEHYQAVAEIIAFVWRLRNRLSQPVR